MSATSSGSPNGRDPIGNEKYVAFTTYRKNGRPVSVPVWVADLGDGRLGFTTSSASYKVKRLRNDNRVALQPSDARGNVREGTEPLTGTGEVLSGADIEEVRAQIKSKYGVQFALVKAATKLQGMIKRGSHGDIDSAIAIRLD